MKVAFINGMLALCLTSLLALRPAPAGAAAAAEELRDTIDGILTVLNNAALKGDAGRQREKLREVIAPRFDFGEMAKRSLGPHWQRRSPEERKEFTQAFRDLLERAYLDKIASYDGEKVRYVREKQEGNHAEVETRIVDAKGAEFAVNYRMHDVSGEWKVYDVVVENISLVNNYRSQFNRVLANSSFEDLIVALKEKKVSAPGTKS